MDANSIEVIQPLELAAVLKLAVVVVPQSCDGALQPAPDLKGRLLGPVQLVRVHPEQSLLAGKLALLNSSIWA